jgi:hypothetical protein
MVEQKIFTVENENQVATITAIPGVHEYSSKKDTITVIARQGYEKVYYKNGKNRRRLIFRLLVSGEDKKVRSVYKKTRPKGSKKPFVFEENIRSNVYKVSTRRYVKSQRIEPNTQNKNKNVVYYNTIVVNKPSKRIRGIQGVTIHPQMEAIVTVRNLKTGHSAVFVAWSDKMQSTDYDAVKLAKLQCEYQARGQYCTKYRFTDDSDLLEAVVDIYRFLYRKVTKRRLY